MGGLANHEKYKGSENKLKKMVGKNLSNIWDKSGFKGGGKKYLIKTAIQWQYQNIWPRATSLEEKRLQEKNVLETFQFRRDLEIPITPFFGKWALEGVLWKKARCSMKKKHKSKNWVPKPRT